MQNLKSIIESKLSTGPFGIKKTDEQGSLTCFCSENPPQDDFEMKIRGYIFDDDDVILKPLPYAETLTDPKTDIGYLYNYRINVMVEGSVIRVFFHDSKWFTTTHRKLDAYKSKWGKDSFGDLFEFNIKHKTGKSLNEFYQNLNPDYIYTFLVGTSEVTRIVSPQYNNVYLILCSDKNNNIIDYEPLSDFYLNEIGFETLDEIFEYAENFSYPYDKGIGIYLLSPDKCFKIFNKEYKKLSNLRNNLPSILYAYLHNVFDEQNNLMFRKLYPKFIEEFNFYDDEILKISKDIQQKYFDRYVKKKTFTLNKHEHNILYHVHGYFLKHKHFITFQDVIEVFKTLPPTNLNKIISERKNLKKLNSKLIN